MWKNGHYSNKCDEIIKNNNVEIINSDIDERKIKIQNKDFIAVFDTGASESMICTGALKNLKNINLEKDIKTFSFFDGTTRKTIGTTELEFNYKGKKYNEIFNVVNNDRRDTILLSNSVVKEMNSNKKEIPIKCKINTQGKGPISWSRAIRSQKDKHDFDILVKNLEAEGVIEKSNSCWLNPVVLTRKRNVDLRFCLDLRRLNDAVTLDEFEIPNIGEILGQLHNKKYFTLIDLKDGFFQIEIEKEDKEKTAFYTGSRLMHFVRMPQGYKNAPAIFQRAMNIVFEDLMRKSCLIYIDDIIVFGESQKEHDKNLAAILERMRLYGLKENEEKRKESVEKIEFLGYELSLNKIRPLTKRAQGILDYPSPKNKKEVQRFLGMLNYDRKFIKGITEIAVPLYKLLNNNGKFCWDENCESAFVKIKQQWDRELELYIPDCNKKFELESDAFNEGLGAVLRQEANVVSYISRALTKEEKNYSVSEKEALAALWAMEKFSFYLLGKEFDLITDHKAIEEIKRKKNFGSHKINRWFERLERFQFNVKYKAGEELVVADALSRCLQNPEMSMHEIKN